MATKDSNQINVVADRMIAEAQSAVSDRIFSVTGFARENISILHQQLRCVNLAWALCHTKRIKRGDVVAIVGGSFSGLMLACSLAIPEDVIVYIFEKEARFLHRFLDKSHRHLSPNLNSRYLGENFNPKWSAPFFDPPIFRWREAVASEVAAKWLHEFEGYCDKLPIFSLLGFEIGRKNIKQREDGLTIVSGTQKKPRFQPIDVDLLIDATGFGDEHNPHGLVDYSYWEAGHRLIYDHLSRKCEVLISGCGDSGLIEAMHYAISDFKHEDVEDLWPSGNRLESVLNEGLMPAKLGEILMSEEILRYDEKVISEVCWWLDTWFRHVNWRGDGWRFEPREAEIFWAIEEQLRPHLCRTFPRRNLKQLEWEEREKFVLSLPLKVQLEVRRAIQPLADAWISRRMAKLLGGLAAGKLLRVRTLHRMVRQGVSITMNGTTPTPYTRSLSPYNTWLMHVLMTFPNVRYHQGKVATVKRYRDGKYCVVFEDGRRETYDRVVTRYGPAKSANGNSLTSPRFCDPHAGNWLLNRVTYSVPTNQPNTFRNIEPSTARITGKLAQVLSRRGSSPANPLDKSMYVNRLVTGPMEFFNKDERYCDPQSWLTKTLRSGVRPSYIEKPLRKLFQRRES